MTCHFHLSSVFSIFFLKRVIVTEGFLCLNEVLYIIIELTYVDTVYQYRHAHHIFCHTHKQL